MGDEEDTVLRSMIGEYNDFSVKIYEMDQEIAKVRARTKELSSALPINMTEVNKSRQTGMKLRTDKAEAERSRNEVVAKIVMYLKPDPDELKTFLETCSADVPYAQVSSHRRCATLEASIRSHLEHIQKIQRDMDYLINMKKDAFAEVTRLGADIASREDEVRELDKSRSSEFLGLCQYSRLIQNAALDRLQERLHLPTSIVKELKRRLAKMVSRSSVRARTKHPSEKELGDTVAESHVWDAAKPEEVRGVVHWVLAVVTSLQRLVVTASVGVCHYIYALIMSLPGVSTACSLFYGLLQAVEDTLRLSSEEIMEAASAGGSGSGSGRSRGYHHLHHRHHRGAESYLVDPSLTAVVLEYKEKESTVPIGFYSAGHVLVGSERRHSIGVGRKYGYKSTIGVLAQVIDRQGDNSAVGGSATGSSIGEAFVRFTVDGIALRDSDNRVMEFTLPLLSRSEIYPTLTLHSQDVHVFSQMSAPDITSLDLQELELPIEEPVEIWCLDGLRLGVST
ncbi:hypothetical protein BBJ29_004034 [Phytophthora kernoviae]|uniref:Uncharacterized protein n=1 Tax=Phytophthora kernoviae TaxID=325452 RepID=A0A421FYT8_9STRA|nr:hypothetical protein BBJ29_004034 [Phytophthora kernoviae]